MPEDSSRKYFWRIYLNLAGGGGGGGNCHDTALHSAPQSTSSAAKSGCSDGVGKPAPTKGADAELGAGDASADGGGGAGGEDGDFFYVDGADPERSNWMRFVNPAYSSGTQNLVACQVRQAIYFYTIRPIMPNTELLVWYSREFARRLRYPMTGEQMMLQIRMYPFY